MKYLVLLLLLFSCIIFSCNKNLNEINNQNISGDAVEIYLVSELDEPRGYCIDVKGSKQDANISRGLQAHTCYSYQGSISVDQRFDKDKIQNNEFYLPYFGVCIEAKDVIEFYELDLSICNQEEKQKFIYDDNGKIVLESNKNLCLTVSLNSRQGGGGDPIHLIRDLNLQICNDEISNRQTWSIRKEF
tara:strand:+ start:291 stop:854 length:564 start_codon:yes stop_codon:yes gene_type:complete